MASPGTCPRGHELAENAVYCTVCWIRVEPVDPEVVAARKRRQRRIWIPLMGAGAVVMGVVVGGSLGVGSGSVTETSVVAGEATPMPPAPASSASDTSTPATPSPSATAEEVVVAAPLAATVSESTTRTLEACVPGDAASVLLKGRSTTDEPWIERTADVVIGDQAACAEGEVSVTVSSDTDAQRWRLVVKDASGERIGKLTLDAPAG